MIPARTLSALIALALLLAAACSSESKGSGDVTTADTAGADTTAPDTAGPDTVVPDTPGADTAGPDTATDAAVDTPAETATGHVYDPPDPATTYVYRVWKPGSSETIDVPGRYGDRETKNGHEYRLLELGDFTAAEIWGLHIWANYADDRLETGGVEVYNPGAPGQPSFAYMFDEPWGGSFLQEEGTSSESHATGTFLIADQEIPFEITVNFTLVSSDESVDVPAGTIEHCIHYRFTENSTDLTNFDTDYWIKSGVGMIKATTIPGFDAMELVSVTLP